MDVLRTRAPDSNVDDYMANALDVSIRHLHSLAVHWDDHRLQDGAVLRFSSSSENDNNKEDDDAPEWRLERNCVADAVEGWIRLWHQVLLLVQSTGDTDRPISFRSLVADLKDHFSGACVTLLASEELRPEIRSMIRWQREELSLDDEEFEEMKLAAQQKAENDQGVEEDEEMMTL
ncbi:MAG: hypothetical protein SGARI_008080 [Bacillariaceae sp.]